ncbi:NnrU family protein [Parahaliea mediterranea]|uniref:NnrU protein n=1 Tax=Parahaliea mediterranea TaxID=651086 RepID=A0A939INX7_9GAMM|nr:NnrU family protein [Parahaliea mediterranea]MBN7799005.1 NnrU protein [Parahaliea mediterranea]
MSLLGAGLLIFIAVHLVPALSPGTRHSLVARLGTAGYRGLFSLAVLAGVALIVVGWRGTQPAYLFNPPAAYRPLGLALVAVAFVLFVAANRASVIRRWVRHPQLTGAALWALAHLLFNGDSRSMLLFSSLGIWALVEIIALNHRDAPPAPTDAPGVMTELATLAIAALVFAAVAWLHPYFTGMAVW